ncbi:uncharacterized protein LOC111400065 [Olea europaea var. sylvestris]|uniref:uncharacterized protein LOC111400065 n=1 Tax=Olea europaea var. sylvestris TaxID=158386 RepID=UPI000C1CD734|nr:uncharacterized protein LOC111400065 [Olea europaea var. sylvestris]
MAVSSSLKTLNSLHIVSMKTTSSSSSFSSMKMKTLLQIQAFVLSHLYRMARALTKAKAILAEVVKDIQLVHFIEFPALKRNKNKRKLFFGSFRLHYNWCSSHVMPVTMPVLESCSTWNSIIPTSEYDGSELSSYLRWLEEKGHENPRNEIDRLADLFIENCHEKFRLEKQESYRRFQEMMARSI